MLFSFLGDGQFLLGTEQIKIGLRHLEQNVVKSGPDGCLSCVNCLLSSQRLKNGIGKLEIGPHTRNDG